jgi:hypothetical protein
MSMTYRYETATMPFDFNVLAAFSNRLADNGWRMVNCIQTVLMHQLTQQQQPMLIAVFEHEFFDPPEEGTYGGITPIIQQVSEELKAGNSRNGNGARIIGG